MSPEIAIADLLAETRPRLRSAAFEISPREGSLLLGHLLGWSEAQVRARGDHIPDAETVACYRSLVERRLKGEPVAYLLGEREFYGRTFYVDERVLIPRPETEHIVEVVLDLELPAAPRLLDIGTGSGCLAITLAAEIPDAKVMAVDLSPAALAITDHNRRHHGLDTRVLAVASDLARSLRLDAFDLVVSNPPYVDRREESSLSPEVTHFEPHLALFAPGEGWSVIERLLDEARHLRSEVHLVLEMGYDQGDWLTRAVAARPHLGLVEIRRDLSGIPRTGVLQRR